METLDERTKADYRTHILPHLRADEKVVFVARWRPWNYVVSACIGVLFFGIITIDFYFDYYVFDTVEAACGNAPWHECGKFYSAASWVVSGSAAMVLVSVFGLLITAAGWHRQVYAITSQRALTARIGVPRGLDSIEFDKAQFRRGSTGVKILKGGRPYLHYFLDTSDADRAEVCLSKSLDGRI